MCEKRQFMRRNNESFVEEDIVYLSEQKDTYQIPVKSQNIQSS